MHRQLCTLNVSNNMYLVRLRVCLCNWRKCERMKWVENVGKLLKGKNDSSIAKKHSMWKITQIRIFLNELRLAEAHFGKASYLSGDNNRGLSSGKCLEVDFSSFNRAPIETYTNVENLANEFECIALPCMNTVYWISNVLPGSDSNWKCDK